MAIKFFSSSVSRFFSFLAAIFLILSFTGVAYAGIVLKVMAMNPSKDQIQKATIKTYLPKETKPEDIINKGDLEIAYDTQQGSYYVYGDFELKPGEVLEQDIEIRDIWVIPFTELENLKQETDKIVSLLKNTELAERITFLKNSIDSKINQIMEIQKNPAPNPEKHISEYRESLKVMESVKTDIVLARSFLSQYKPLSSAVVWKLILGIIIFLGILGTSFYFIWQKQIKTVTQDEAFLMPKEDADSLEKNPERHEAKKEEKLDSDNIRKILGDKEHKG